MKLKHTIIILLFLFTVIPMYVFGAFMMYENNRKIERVISADLEAISSAQILDIKNFCEARRENMEILAGYEIIRDAIRQSLNRTEIMGSRQKEYLENMLAERKAYNGYLESISVIDRDFRVVASSEPFTYAEQSDLSASKEEMLARDFFISDMIYRERGDETIAVLIACQQVENKGELMGYIVEEISASYFHKNRVESNFINGTIYLLDGEGKLITAGTVEEEREEYITSEEERKDFIKAWGEVDLEKSPAGSIDYQVAGAEYITYYSRIDYTDWSILLTIDLSEYKSSRYLYRSLLITALLVTSVFILVINYFISKKLARPIETIIHVLKKVQEEQDYSLRIEDNGKDEMGRLSRKVNNLLDYIEKEKLQEKERQRYLERKADRDPLTGVKNKKAVEEKLQDMLQRASEKGVRAAVGFLDIDNFREYNTNYGHMEGDCVIQFVAAILEENISGTVGRHGGDEFVFGIENVSDMEVLKQSIKKIFQKLNKGFFSKENGKRIPISCSMGVVVGEGEELRYSTMIRYADAVMYQVKQKGKNSYEIRMGIER